MEINDELIDKLAVLAKLEIGESERADLKQELERILSFISRIGEVDLKEVEPLVYLTDHINMLRSDEVKKEISKEEAFLNAPDHDEHYFRVPKIIGK